MQQQIMPQDVKDELSSDAMRGILIPIKGTMYTVHEMLGKPGNAGVTRKCADELGDFYAMKFTTYASYDSSSTYLAEVSKARQLRNCLNIARLESWDEVDLPLPKSGRHVKTVILISEYVRGEPLERYLATKTMTPDFMNAFVDGICEALHAMRHHRLNHNDLHNGNILIGEPDSGCLNPDHTIVKIIDTGSVSSDPSPISPGMDDHAYLVSHLVSIYNNILDGRYNLRSWEKRYLDSVKSILTSMVDEDIQQRLTIPKRIKEEFERAWNAAIATPYIEKTSPVLGSPFDYIQAEHIVSDKLLEALFSDKCPWYDKVRGPDPVNIDGPRGCGKSTVFRMLRLKTLIHTKSTDKILSLKEVGFYVSCTAEIGSRFAFLAEATAKKLEREIVHFFNLSILYEIVDTIAEISKHEDIRAAAGWTKQTEHEFCCYLLDLMNMPREKDLPLSGVSWLEHLRHILDRERLVTHQSLLQEKKLDFATPPSFLGDVSRFLVDKVSFFKGKRILFLLDDYSVHRVPPHVQQILNHVIWTQVPNYVFKISSEVGGIVAYAPLGGTADTSREFVEVNIGVEYVNLHEARRAEEFIADVLDRRLELAGYSAKTSQLLGKTEYPKGMSLGPALRAEANKELTGSRVYYHGTECIAGLCSGDIATTLDIVRHIFQEAGVTRTSTDKVAPNKQHKAIQNFSRELYSKIGDYIPVGKEMQKLVHAFGWASRHLLTDAKGLSGGKDRIDAYEMIRIEIDDDPSKPELPKELQLMLHELLRRAIFVELPKGRSRRGVLARRLQLRRAYCPVFKISLSHSEPMGITVEQFRLMLSSPKQMCEGYVGNRLGKPVSLEKDINQLPMHQVLESQ